MAAPSYPSYETLYGVGLLDDIHNYFPALLYDSQSFATVPEVLAYVQMQTRQRFDLFSLGRGAYLRSQRRTTVPPLYRPMNTRVVYTTEENIPVINTYNRIDRSTTDSLLNLFTTMLNPNFMNAVIVRPSPETITANTTVSTVSTSTNEVCAICQDGYEVGNERRSLNACHHTFHKSCIDTWFQENVHCPVCRHDIRVVPTANAGAAASEEDTL